MQLLNKLFNNVKLFTRKRAEVRNPSWKGSAYHKIEYSHTSTAKPNKVSQKKRRIRARRARSHG